MPKPTIIVLSADGDTESFKWISGGWNATEISHTQGARDLMAKARKCIELGKNVLDVCERLRDAGFEVQRTI